MFLASPLTRWCGTVFNLRLCQGCGRMSRGLACLAILFLFGTVRGQSHTTTPFPFFTDVPDVPEAGVCAAWEQIASGSSVCSVDSSCTHLECSALTYTLRFGVLACTDPIALSVVVLRSSDNTVLLNNSYSHSQVVPFTYSGVTAAQLNITVIPSPLQDSITIGVSVIPFSLPSLPSAPIVLIPETSVPVDRTQCNATPTSPGPSRATTSPVPSGTPPHPQTCAALQRIESSSGSQCHASQSCTTLNCDLAGGLYHAAMTVLPCDDPPDIRVLVRDSADNVLLNETFSQSREVPVDIQGVHVLDLIVNVSHTHNPDAIVVGVSTHSETLGSSELIPSTSIPLDRSNCSSVATETPPTGTTPPTTPRVSKTCQALQQIQSTATNCETAPSCTSLLCDFFLLHSNLTVLPCHEPPAIRIQVTSSNGSVLIDDVLTRSRLENVTFGGTTLLRLNVSIQHTADAILLKVDTISLTGTVTPLIPQTRIPIDRCDCPNVHCVSTTRATPSTRTTPSTSSGSGPGTTSTGHGTSTTSGGGQHGATTTTDHVVVTADQSSSNQLVKIVVPVTIVAILLLVAVIILVIVGVVYSSKKRARAYNFHRMTFSNVNEEEEAEED